MTLTLDVRLTAAEAMVRVSGFEILKVRRPPMIQSRRFRWFAVLAMAA